jgi:hypothetical protein
MDYHFESMAVFLAPNSYSLSFRTGLDIWAPHIFWVCAHSVYQISPAASSHYDSQARPFP